MATLLEKRRFFRFYRFLHAIILITLTFIFCIISLFTHYADSILDLVSLESRIVEYYTLHCKL